MKKIFLLTTLLCAACWQADAQYVSKAWVSDQKDGTYINPVQEKGVSTLVSVNLIDKDLT